MSEFTCDCDTPLPWPTKTEDRTCPECGAIWEREPIDLGAGARLKSLGWTPPATARSAIESPGAFEHFMAAEYPSTPLTEAIVTVEHMREAFKAGWKAAVARISHPEFPPLSEPLLNYCPLCGGLRKHFHCDGCHFEACYECGYPCEC